MKSFKEFIIKAVKNRATYVAIIAILGAGGIVVSPDLADIIIQICMTLAGLM